MPRRPFWLRTRSKTELRSRELLSVRVFISINMTLPVPSFKPHLFRHRMVCWHTRHGLIVGQYRGDQYGTGRHLAWRDTTPVGPGRYGDR